MFKKNLEKLKQDLNKNNIDLALITDDDSIYYFTGYFDFLHMSFGRPTILLVPKDSVTVLITPLIDAHLVKKNCPVDKIITWNDGVDNEWREELPKYLKKNTNIAIEKFKISTLVLDYISSLDEQRVFKNISPILDLIRMVKTQDELKIENLLTFHLLNQHQKKFLMQEKIPLMYLKSLQHHVQQKRLNYHQF